MEVVIAALGGSAFFGLLIKLVLVLSGQIKSEREGRAADNAQADKDRADAAVELATAKSQAEVERVRADTERASRITAETAAAETKSQMLRLEGELNAVKEELARVSARLNVLIAASTGGGNA